MNCDEMAGGRLTVCEQKLLYASIRLVSISSNFLFIARTFLLGCFALLLLQLV